VSSLCKARRCLRIFYHTLYNKPPSIAHKTGYAINFKRIKES